MHPLNRLLRYATRHQRSFGLASTYSVLNKFFDVMPEVLIGAAVDVVVNQEASFLTKFGVIDVFSQLLVLAVITLVVWVLESIFEFLYSVEWRNLAQTIQHELRIDTYANVQKLPMAYFENKTTGGLLSVLNDDVNQLERFLDGGANSLIQVFTTVVIVGGIFFYIAPSVAALAMFPIPIILVGAFYFQMKIAPRYFSVRAQVGSLAARLANNISGIATILSFTAEEREIETLKIESNKYREANAQAIRLSSSFIPLIRMAIMCGFIATLVWGGWLTVQNELGVGQYSILVFLTQRLLWPLTGLAQTVDLYQRAMASTHRILDLLDTPVPKENVIQSFAPNQTKGKIEFEAVSFTYVERKQVLKDVSFTVQPGQRVGIVGATGSGKSTLVKLILRFYEPSAGVIRLDDVNIAEASLHSLRSVIGLVSQDVFLFDGTLRDNLVYGKPDASEKEIEFALKAAEALEFVQHLPQGLETPVGERGQRLSGGQRQRLSIARAILKNPPILILDEATSAVDNETEAAIQRSLEKISVGRTTFVIAHRLSTVRNADFIFVLSDGQIVEFGNHEALVEKGGLYKALWNVQTGLAAQLKS